MQTKEFGTCERIQHVVTFQLGRGKQWLVYAQRMTIRSHLKRRGIDLSAAGGQSELTLLNVQGKHVPEYRDLSEADKNNLPMPSRSCAKTAGWHHA